MKTSRSVVRLALLSSLLAPLSSMAQQINGVPGAPSSTVTIDGKQIPPPPMKFGGVIKESATDSTPWWQHGLHV